MKNAMRSATPPLHTWIQGCYWMVYCILLSFSSVYLLEQGLSNTEIGLFAGAVRPGLRPIAAGGRGPGRADAPPLLGQLSGRLVGGMGLCALGLLLVAGQVGAGGLFMVLLALLRDAGPLPLRHWHGPRRPGTSL